MFYIYSLQFAHFYTFVANYNRFERRVMFLLIWNLNSLYWATKACLTSFRHCKLLVTKNYNTFYFIHAILTSSFFPMEEKQKWTVFSFVKHVQF